MKNPKRRTSAATTGFLVAVALVCACCGIMERHLNGPPALTAAYTSSEALLVMEDLAGALIASLDDESEPAPFTNRQWKTQGCASGWDRSISWDGFVSVSVAYRFDFHAEPDARLVDYGEQVAAALEALGMDPALEYQDGPSDLTVRAERDDGLSIIFATSTGLNIATGCVVDDGQSVYTPPHANIPPSGDIQDLWVG